MRVWQANMPGGWTTLLLVVIVLSCLPSLITSKCLTHTPEVLPKRHFYYNGQSLPLTIETSDRESHQLASHILKILLEEVLGYDLVFIHGGYNSMNASEILNRLAGCSQQTGCWHGGRLDVPETMINLEVWMSAGYNMEPWVNGQYIIDAGPLGPSGRFGWFLPTFQVEEIWKKSSRIIDHWRALKLDPLTDLLTLDEEKSFLKNFLTHQEPEKHDSWFCRSKQCQNGILHTSKCKGLQSCAMLLSSYPELDAGLLKQQVDNLGLDVNIAWIGSRLESFVHDRTYKNKPTLFFSWMPNSLTAVGNYTRVKFPLCKSTPSDPKNCDFEVNQLSKAMWVKLGTHTPEAYSLLTKMHFTQKQYEDLLRLHHSLGPHASEESDYERGACEWIRQNVNTWKDWIPKNLSNKTRIYLSGMFPITGPFLRQPGIVPGAQMALEFVNHDPNLLTDYELLMVIQDTQCKADVVMKQFMYFVVNDTHPVAGILGPGCSETAEPIAGVSKHFNTIIVSYSAEAVTLGDRDTYPFFFRTVPQMNQYGVVYMDIFSHFNWQQVALLAEDGQEFPEYHTFLEDLFLTKGIAVIYQRKMPRQSTPEDAVKYIESIKKRGARIIILTMFEYSARAVICEAYRQKMTAMEGYQWFLPAWFTLRWWDTDTFNKLSFEQGFMPESVPCTTAEMFRAIQGHIALSSALFAADDTHIQGNLTVKQWKNNYAHRLRSMGGIEESPFATYAYDAVWVFALGLDRLLSEDPSALESLHTDHTTQKFMGYLNNLHFPGVSGPVQFHGADRVGIINIYQYIGNTSILIGQYLPNKNDSERTLLNESKIMWMTGRRPTDGRLAPRQCSVEALRAVLGVDCDTAIIIANIVGVGLFGVLMIIGLIIVKKRYDAKVRATRERMQELGLLSDTSWLCLDQWEVAREHVVLNRKLGEGAFGTVYGGEALIEEAWVAVAVKTLKIGSNPEEKLDFLSEAEMMKRFDHENIVKLLGVCTRGEPAYTIMEFMLHGDLKTFLLARRQLVGQATKEAEDITPEALNRMAMDVARGLSYLTELKYVHRDLACRNCLVHASKEVKIGDFGMTRPMYDSDYYRFNKRGMLPVRWMAPESLMDGLFTPMSDIWSFGVLLYEIMTFGSFPYQGMSNKQVLEHVKKGNTIQLPAHCHEELKSILMSCWALDPEFRPSVNDLIVILKAHGNLVQPCLDAPLSAVAMEGTSACEVAIPNNRQSVSSHRLRVALRTSSDHTQLQNCVSQDSKLFPQSPTSISGATDPFALLTQAAGAACNRRSRVNSENCPSMEDRTETMSASGSDVDDNVDTPCLRQDERTVEGKSSKSSSPESPIPLRYIALVPNNIDHDHGSNTDYASEHPAKEFWHLNGTSVV